MANEKINSISDIVWTVINGNDSKFPTRIWTSINSRTVVKSEEGVISITEDESVTLYVPKGNNMYVVLSQDLEYVGEISEQELVDKLNQPKN